MKRGPLVVAVLWSAFVAAAVSAQEDPRALFERGTRAVEEGRFADAQPDLERSLSIAPRAATAFNLIVALDGLARLVRASDVCEQLVGGRYGELTPPQRAEAERTCAELRARVPRLVIRGTGPTSLEIRIDGRVVGEVGEGAQLETALDPGWHHVSATVEGRPPIERSISLAAAERLELPLEAPASPLSSPGDTRTSPTGGPDLGLVLGLVIGGAVLAGGAITLGVVLSSGGPEPAPGDFRVVMTLVDF